MLSTTAVEQGCKETPPTSSPDPNFISLELSQWNTPGPALPFMLVVGLHNFSNFPHFRHGLLGKDKHQLEKPVLI